MVQFGDYITKCRSAAYANEYLRYEELKKLLEDMKANKIHSSDNFYKALEESYTRTKSFAEAWLVRLEAIQGWMPSIIGEALDLNQFIFMNQEALRKIVKKHDKNMPDHKLYPIWRWKMDFCFTQRVIDVLLNSISKRPPSEVGTTPDLFSTILKPATLDFEPAPVSAPSSAPASSSPSKSRYPKAGGKSELTTSLLDPYESSDAHPPEPAPAPKSLSKQTDSFVRQSTKYWVKQCDLAAVCSVLAENLDVSSFTGRPWTRVSSVYLDNKNRRCYTERLAKDSGARIVRLRTYDDVMSKVYVERKVHYERWTGDTSSKDRFPIEEGQVMALLRGQTVSVAQKHQELSAEIQKMVHDYQLYPTLRVDYDRIAFQPPNHDHVRVSIDMNMRYVNEHTSHFDWRTDDSKLSSSDEIMFPYCIVEIKLREPYISTPPQWLSSLESSSLMHKENNFSKYLHGTYQFYLMHKMSGEMPANLELRKPVWYDNMSFMTPQMAVVNSEDMAKAKLAKEKRAAYDTSGSHWFARMLGMQDVLDDSGKPVRVEPKTFFANERTFLSWFNAAIFVSSIGLALAQGTVNGNVLGGLLILIGLIIIVYAIATYNQRTFSLLNKRSNGYADRFGPVFLALTISLVYIAGYIYAVA